MKSLLVLLCVAAGLAVPAASAGPREQPVYFTKGEQLTTIHRGGSTLVSAVRALLGGPTATESARGFTTEIPAGTALRSATVENGVARVDLTRTFEAGGGSASMIARLAELVYTATAVPGVRSLRLLLDGKEVEYIGGEGLIVDRPVTRAYFAPTAPPPPRAPSPRPKAAASSAAKAVQLRLVALGYLPRGSADGIVGRRTTSAVLAFQSWQGLPRTGALTQSLLPALRSAERPTPSPRAGRRIEVDLRRQVALLVDARGIAARTIHVSTGSGTTPTPRGSYRVFRKELRSWSIPFREWLPYASYFNGGIAFHEFASVPAYAASHGCVRLPAPEAPFVFRFATLGTPVVVS